MDINKLSVNIALQNKFSSIPIKQYSLYPQNMQLNKITLEKTLLKIYETRTYI